MATKNIPVAPQPPYSPDLSPCDFFLFPRLIIHLKGRHYGALENIQTSVTDELKAIPEQLRTMETSSPALCGFPRQLLRRNNIKCSF